MDIYIIISFINGLVALIFGFLIFSKNWKNKINYTFFLMSVSFAIWSFSYSRWLSVNTSTEALFWSKMLNFGATFIPIFYLHWILSILGITKEKKGILIFGYFITLFFSFFSFTPAYISSVAPVRDFLYWPQAGFLYVIFLVVGYFGLVGYGLKELLKARKNSDPEKTHQINYVILGSLFGFGGGATNFPLMFGIGFVPPIGQLFVVLFVIIFALATLKYHLFEIKLILTELLVFIMAVIIIILFFLMPTQFLKILIGIIIILFSFFGYFLIRAIHEEVSQKEEAERISKMKTEFISIASHQLRTPLAAIRGYTSMLEDGDYGDLPTPAKTAIRYIHESSVGMIKLINSLLSISRLEKGQIELNLENISIEEIIKDCIKDFEFLAKEKGLTIIYNKPKINLPTIKGDAEKLKQSFSNIINNAVLYTLEGKIEVSLNKENNDIIIQIKDTGVGIDSEEQEKMFKSFSRGKGGTELYTQGTGLGLYVAKNFVEMHNGSISVYSEGKNKGSLFTIKLPIQSILDSRHKFNFTEK